MDHQPTLNHPRFINFRKVGKLHGLPFFRSGELSSIHFEDALLLHQKLGMRLYFDLRTHREIERQGKPPHFDKVNIQWIHQPMDQITDPFFQIKVPTPKDYGEFYIRMLPDAIIVLNQILYHASKLDPGTAAAFGCSGGKDRTGVIAALLLKSLGRDNAMIMEDYLLSRTYLEPKMDHFVRLYKPHDVPEPQYREQMRTKCESIEIFLNHPDLLKGIDQTALSLFKTRLNQP